ncbi:hypothetical protein B0T25DRAFT_70976 [Lasiosphaeria hispida]|uniref:Dockerin type 1 n=1 Tax=Lasiosphaeria hispida TaxID=260671 RepID=A0AAJ0MLB4_9PEZI|nr:hypothetical protein B0T25DRAFT_70976 [Lasiosphaeria hispida]
MAAMLSEPRITVLGPDPAHRRCILNGNAFQQDAIVTFNAWQYAAFYSPLAFPEPLYIHLARRPLPSGPWEILVLSDYPQTVDDGHNTVQLGICPSDGTIHLSYDHHCDILRYRVSVRSLATKPSEFSWTEALFTPTLNYLPGLPSTHSHFSYVTYPRFGFLGTDLFCSFRDGKAGLGNDHFYRYSGASGFWTFVGTPLTGVWSNPYVNGWDFRGGKIHVTWTWRGFVEYEGWDDLQDSKHKQQAGPNGAENNFDVCYAWSEDGGETWRGEEGVVGRTVRTGAKGITAFEVPKGKGLMNQEAQAVDADGGVHVLNRDAADGGHLWKHYYRVPEGTWTRQQIQPITGGSRRGQLAISRDGDLFIILPDSTTTTIKIVKAAKSSGYATYEEVWTGHGFTGEPLIDSARLEHDNVLSVFIRGDVKGSAGKKNVVVLDFQL